MATTRPVVLVTGASSGVGKETARAFAMKEVLPLANKLDPEKGDMPPELLQKLADMG